MRPESFMILDEALPRDVFDTLETELWWDACYAIHGAQAWAKWPAFRREQEARSREVEHG